MSAGKRTHVVKRLKHERGGFGDGRELVAAALAHTGPTGSGEQLGSPKARSASQACPWQTFSSQESNGQKV